MLWNIFSEWSVIGAIILVMVVIFIIYLPKIKTNTNSIDANTEAIKTNTAAIAANSSAIEAIQLFLTTPTTILATNLATYYTQNTVTNMGSLTFDKVGYWQVTITMIYVPATPSSATAAVPGVEMAYDNNTANYYYYDAGINEGVDVSQLQFGLYKTEYSASNTNPEGVAAAYGNSMFLLQEHISMKGYNIYTLTFMVQIITAPTKYYNISSIQYTPPADADNAVILAQTQNAYATLNTIPN
jgi:hypothetical protein